MPSVSIIIAAYKAVDDLERAVGSVLGQTISDLEVIIIDDQSPDRTFDLAQELSARDPRVRALQLDRNSGPGFARNVGLHAARGDWVGVLDADDAFRPDRLERLIAIGEESGADVVSDNLALRDPVTGDISGLMFPTDWLPSETHVLTPAAFVIGNIGNAHRIRLAYGFMKPIVRKSFLDAYSIHYRISRFAEDYIFYLELLAHRAVWLTTAVAYYEYDIRPGSLSAKVSAEDGQVVAAAERELLSMPAVRANPELADAMRRHLRSMELSTAWVRFANALKARDVPKALAAASADPATIAHVIRESAIHLRRAVNLRRS